MIGTMKAESIVIGVAGTVFGLVVGWIIGTQQAPARPFAQAAAAPAAAQAPAGMPAASTGMVDEAQAAALRNIAERIRPTSSRACSSATCTSTPSGIRTPSSGTKRR